MISFGHLVVVLIIVLLLFGPSRLEKLGPSLGRAIRGFKKGLNGDEDEEKEKNSKKEEDQNAKSSEDKPN